MIFDLHKILQWFLYNPREPFLYQTVPFVIIFSVFYVFYGFLQRKPAIRNILLLLFCLFFYYKFSGFFVGVLVLMATADFFIGKQISKTEKTVKRRAWVFLSLLINLGSLIYFKYTNLLVDFFNLLTNSGLSLSFRIIQPVGISYFVFKSIGYVIDINREMIEKPEKNYIRYLLYVSYFPNILAGPITKARDLLGKLSEEVVLNKKTIASGLFFLSMGLIKKIAVADYIGANMVDRVYEGIRFYTSLDLWMASYGGLIHLFFDFSGYTDIVIGISMLLGFEIEGNFNQPFKATNITSFWKRWHISLYEWLGEYLYQPIAFAMRSWGKSGIIIAVFITFFISGIWHGANLTFILWGLIHGTAIAIEVFVSKPRMFLAKKLGAGYRFVSMLLTFQFLTLACVLVNNENVLAAVDYYKKMTMPVRAAVWREWFQMYHMPFLVMTLALLLQYLPLSFYEKLKNVWLKLPMLLHALLFALLVFLLFQISSIESLPFRYIEY